MQRTSRGFRVSRLLAMLTLAVLTIGGAMLATPSSALATPFCAPNDPFQLYSYVAVNDTQPRPNGPVTVDAASGVRVNDYQDTLGTHGALPAAVQSLLWAAPAHGSVVLNTDGSYTYTPNAGFTGTDTFQYVDRHSTSLICSGVGTVTLPPSNNMNIDFESYTAPYNGTLTVPAPGVLANDGDPWGYTSGMTATMTVAPSSGYLDLRPDGSFSYTPAPNWGGRTTFTYKTCRKPPGPVGCSVEMVDELLTAESITAVPDSYPGTEDTTLNISSAGSGVLANDQNNTRFGWAAAVLSQPAHGTVVMAADGTFTYQPAANYNSSTITGPEPDVFTYKVCSQPFCSQSSTASVSITVAPTDDPPTAVDDAATTAEDTPVGIDPFLNDYDIDDFIRTALNATSYSVELLSTPAHGSLTQPQPGHLVYTPNANFNGTDSFTYRACGSLCSAPATVSLTVTAVNDPPVAVNDTAATSQDHPVAMPVLGNDTDPDGTAVSYPAYDVSIITPPAHGTFDGQTFYPLVYIPDPGFAGTDSYTYKVCDTFYGGCSATAATATITVTAVKPVKSGTFENPRLPVNTYREFVAGQTIGAWTVTAGSVDLVETTSIHAAGGKQSLDLAGAAPGTISQQLTLPGTGRYKLAFKLAGNPDCGGHVTRVGVLWNGTTVFNKAFDTTGHTDANPGWVSRSVTVNGSAGPATLAFTNLSGGACGAMIDTVTLKELP